jgi:hypothetical protein
VLQFSFLTAASPDQVYEESAKNEKEREKQHPRRAGSPAPRSSADFFGESVAAIEGRARKQRELQATPNDLHEGKRAV